MFPAISRRVFAFAGLLLAFSLPALSSSSLPSSSFLGISPQHENYYSRSTIPCRDGSKTFARNRLNDGFCDCPDGTDEPDCCDGSDEYDGGVMCRNECVKDGITSDLNMGDAHLSVETKINYFSVREKKIRVELEELLQTLRGLRIITVFEVASLMGLLIFLCGRTKRIPRRRYLWRNL